VHPEPVAERSNLLHLGGRFGAQLVVEVGRHDLEAQSLLEVPEEKEAGDRVGPAGERHEHFADAAEHLFAAGEAEDGAKGSLGYG
jgi:hypothetical protein